MSLLLASALAAFGATASAAQSAREDVVARMRVPVMVDGAWVLPGRNSRPAGAVEDYSGMIDEACAYYGCDPAYLESVMWCESNGDPGAVAYNPSSGNYTRGLFQIDDMWGVGMDPAAQIWWAAEHLTAGDVYWVCG